MQSRLSFVLILVATFSLIDTAVYGQSLESYGVYCTAGLQPDGYIDFSGLPPAPTMNPQPGPHAPSAAVTATLPVKGVAGLTVTVTIPALSPQSYPVYTVDGGTLHLNGLPSPPSSGTPAVLTLTFNQSIAGVGLNTETIGRFGYAYTLQVGLPADLPAAFATTANGYTYREVTPQAQSLQVVGLQTTFQSASVEFQGDEYEGITLSNVRVQSASAPDPASVVPTNGLQQWLRADTAGVLGGGSTWKDQSGLGHDATPSPNPPILTADGRNCQAAWQFTGNQYFSFNLPIAGWNEMTVFLVAKAGNDAGSYSDNTAILWTEDAPWGNTYVSPYQTHVYARFGTAQTTNNLFYTRPGGSIGQDFNTTRAVHDHGTDSLYVNGLLVQNREGKLPVLGGATGAGTIGQGINNTYFDGEISEILVYNRVLSVHEAGLVELYLAQKYGTQ